jgi:hypothetical protein
MRIFLQGKVVFAENADKYSNQQLEKQALLIKGLGN